MPSPFPGMDPYLESPDWFPCLHDCLIVGILASLQPRLPEPYYAQSTQRVWLEASERYVEPDAEVLHSELGLAGRLREAGGIAVAEAVVAEQPVEVLVEPIEDEPFEEPYVEIRRRQGSRIQLVTSIEVLSLSNKRRGNPGRRLYLSKQEEVLNSQANLVEIDLLRGGEHVTAVPRGLADAKAGPFDYHVCVHRPDRANVFLIYPVRLEARLPTIAIPLLPGDREVTLPLQAIFDQAYDTGPYRRGVGYGADEIFPPLSPEQARWAKTLLAGQLR